MFEYTLPVWKGVLDSPTYDTAPLSIGLSKIKGIYKQLNKRIIKYDDHYSHMTPLQGSKYIEKLRKGKIEWIVNSSNMYDKILEIGGGDCMNYNYFDCENYTVIDPTLKYTQELDKLLFISDYFENVTLNEKYDAILMLSVLEHVDDPELIMGKTVEVLDDKGSIFVFIPVVDKQFALGDFNALIHEHMHYLTYNGAKQLFTKYGLSIESYYVKNDGGFFKLIKDDKNHIKKIDDFHTYALDVLKNNFDYQLEKFIKILNNGEKTIFYGATNGLNNLFHLTKDEVNVDYEKYRITDSDKTKWGKYIGSHPLPIIPLDKLSYYKTVCISALSFYDEILKTLEKDKVIISTGSI